MVGWKSRAPREAIAFLGGMAAIGCALGSPPPLHYPNRSGKLGGALGYSVPLQPARARLLASDGRVHDVRANTAIIAPEVPLFGIAYAIDPKLFGSYGLGEHSTLVGDFGWHRIGLSTQFFTGSERAPGFKLAVGARAGIFVREGWGWLELSALPALSDRWLAELGLGVAAGRFRHFLTVPDFNSSGEEGVIPTVRDFMDLYRDEVRVRLPLGASIRFQKVSAVFALTPGVTLVHDEPGYFGCRASNCSESISLQDFSQVFAIELQAGLRF